MIYRNLEIDVDKKRLDLYTIYFNVDVVKDNLN